MKTPNLLKRGQTWFVRVKVPRPLRAKVGRDEIVRTLRTHSHTEAQRLRHAAIVEINREIEVAAAAAVIPREAVEYAQAVALAERKAVLAGEKSMDEASTIVSQYVDDWLDKQRRVRPHDPATGNVELSNAEEGALTLAHRILSGDVENALENVVARHIAAKEAEGLPAATVREKRRRLEAFMKWAGAGTDVQAINKRLAARYVTDVIQRSGSALKTQQTWLGHLIAWGNWYAAAGYVEFSPWGHLSSLLKGSKKGKQRSRRAYRGDELVTLLGSLESGTALLPMTCMALWSGMRIDEIAELKASDIIGDAFVIQAGKTDNSIRQVPIHPAIRAGVDRLLETECDEFLIPGLLRGGYDEKRSHYVSKDYGRHIRSIGLDDPKLTFHSLRNSFHEAGETAGLSERIIDLLTGHAKQSMLATYSTGPEFSKLRDAMLKIDYSSELTKLAQACDWCVTDRPRARKTPAVKAELQARRGSAKKPIEG